MSETARQVAVVEQILSANDEIALGNRCLLDQQGVVAINLMASPGAGKTSLILRTIDALKGRLRVGVIEGDLAGRIDADRVAATGTPVIQINTGGGCHLDAMQVQGALRQLPLDQIDLLFIENVGNLVCPAGFALGERLNVTDRPRTGRGRQADQVPGHVHGRGCPGAQQARPDALPRL